MSVVELSEQAHGGAEDGDAEVAEAAPPARGRLRPGPLLPERLRPLNAPKLWLEAAMIAVIYELYTLTRLAAPAHKEIAIRRGYSILNLERDLHINIELSVNHWADKITPLVVGANYYYATLHFIVPVVVLIWVHRKFPDRYRAVRTVLFAVTGLALISFYAYALCPPRFMPGLGYIDSFDTHNTWGTAAGKGVGGLPSAATDLYAAMPSLHIGWSAWCGLAIAHLAERRWVKALGILYPCVTFFVIISTANHYVLDAVFALVTLALAFLVQRLLHGRPVYRATAAPAKTASADGMAGPSDGTGPGDGHGTADLGGRRAVVPRQFEPVGDL
jgi:hypothetical protein